MSSNQLLDMQALLGAQMDDIDDLPPVGVPPSGHYDLEVTCTLEDNAEKTGQYFKFAYEVKNINQLANEEEAADVSVGTKFSDRISPFKKTGEVNEFGMGKLKEVVAPYAAHFGDTVIGETVQKIKAVRITAELKRRVDRKDPERWNFDLKNIVVL
jgi:hypothetical protein